jgi:hypothetical protein
MKDPRSSRSKVVLLAALAILGPSCGLGTTAESELAPTIAALQTQASAQETRISDQLSFISYLATHMPRSTPPPLGQPSVTPPVRGAVVIEEGRCCVGGIAGQPLQIRVAFQAFSPLAPVTEMRVRVGGRWFGEEEFLETDWVPFEAAKTYDFTPPINWAGFYVSAQYRDASGWVSPIYQDDVSVEGMPAPPTPGATP